MLQTTSLHSIRKEESYPPKLNFITPDVADDFSYAH